MASHARVYMWLFIVLTVLWAVMRLFIYPIIKLFWKCCMDCEKRWQSDPPTYGDDFLKCAGLTSIGSHYSEIKEESRMYKRLLSNATKNGNTKMVMIFQKYLDCVIIPDMQAARLRVKALAQMFLGKTKYANKIGLIDAERLIEIMQKMTKKKEMVYNS